MSFLQTRSEEFQQATLPAVGGNFAGSGFTVFQPQATEPGRTGDPLADFGVWQLAFTTVGPNRVEVVPYAALAPGQTFNMRLWGWNFVGQAGQQQAVFWWPQLLAEFACTVCNTGGLPAPGPGPSPYPVQPNENFCDTITLTQGLLGDNVGNPGYVHQIGTDFIASILLAFGSPPRKIQFDFDTAGANCLWRRA